MPERNELRPYWNKTEVFWWAASAAVLIAYAVAVLVFGADADPMVWLDNP